MGAATAVRWYSPADSGWGTHVRYVWNAAAIVQMWWYKIPWGGSLAVRRSLLQSANLLTLWKTTFCEDTPLEGALRRADRRLHYVVDLVLDSRESVGLGNVTRWIQRQLLTARLHHGAWPAVFGHALLTSAAMLGLIVCAVAGFWRGEPRLSLLSLAGLLIYELGMVALVRWIDISVTTSAEQESQRVSETRPGMLRTAADIVCSQVLYPWAALAAAATTRVAWRKINYRIGRRAQIERLDYCPFTPDATASDNHSL